MANISVEYIDHLGTDLSVVNAARVSFDKGSDWVQRPYDPDKDNLTLLDEEIPAQYQPYENCPVFYDDKGRELSGFMLSRKDEKLISYLARHNHKSPFNHAFASFRCKAPIFCARQLVKHEYMPWNETSRRYVDSEPEFYTPDTWRKKADNVKQGSSDEVWGLWCALDDEYNAECLRRYKILIDTGCCAEQARMVLPQSMMTEWIWSGSLFAIAKMCKLRLDPHTQYETRLVAQPIADKMSELYPVSWKALMNG